MGRLQVLVATMHQKDISLYKRMRLQSDAVVANQNGENAVSTYIIDGNKVEMISTDTIGVGCNRNIALLAADADILLFADDDISYYDGYKDAVLRAFEQRPNADMIVFRVDFSKNNVIYERSSVTKGRIRLWRALRYGACALAVRRQSLLKANVWFSQLFGGGCAFSSGEDSLFLVECLRRRMKLFSDPFVLGNCATDTSTWFRGYNQKYFYDKGIWLAAAFPRTKHLMKWYFWLKMQKKTDLPACEALRLIKRGIRGYRKQEQYCDSPLFEGK